MLRLQCTHWWLFGSTVELYNLILCLCLNIVFHIYSINKGSLEGGQIAYKYHRLWHIYLLQNLSLMINKLFKFVFLLLQVIIKVHHSQNRTAKTVQINMQNSLQYTCNSKFKIIMMIIIKEVFDLPAFQVDNLQKKITNTSGWKKNAVGIILK